MSSSILALCEYLIHTKKGLAIETFLVEITVCDYLIDIILLRSIDTMCNMWHNVHIKL